jgi:hypothetical protein
MKLIAVVLLTATRAFAGGLTDAGSLELSGTISFSNYKAVAIGRSYSVFTFAPQVSYFVVDRFSVGITTGLGYLPGLSVVSPSSGESSTVLQLFLAPAYHFVLDSKTLAPFVEGEVGYGIVTSGSSSSGLSYGGRTGIKIVPADHLVLALAVQFVSLRLFPSGSSERIGWDYWTFGVGVGGYF